MSKDANPLAPLGRAKEEEWARRNDAELLEKMRAKDKKKGKDKKPADATPETGTADSKPAEQK
jgi:hypothetical protein